MENENENENEHSLAYEMLQELNDNNGKRWCFIAVVEALIIVLMIVGFFWYENQYDFETNKDTYQYVEDNDMQNSTINQEVGE